MVENTAHAEFTWFRYPGKEYVCRHNKNIDVFSLQNRPSLSHLSHNLATPDFQSRALPDLSGALGGGNHYLAYISGADELLSRAFPVQMTSWGASNAFNTVQIGPLRPSSLPPPSSTFPAPTQLDSLPQLHIVLRLGPS